MSYKLLCIYESKSETSPKLRVEVNIAGKSNSLAPFMRKVTTEDLYQGGVDNDELLALINHSGRYSQPFIIPECLLKSPLVRDMLIRHRTNYIQSNGRGSVKRTLSPLQRLYGTGSYPTGKLLEGELYIDNLTSWNKGIRVRFKYIDTFFSFFPNYSPLPYLTHEGILLQRDRHQESTLLNVLGELYDVNTGTVSISGYDTATLQKFVQGGWNVYVSKPSGGKNRVHGHCDPSGIVWFSTEEQPREPYSQQILEGFLQSRNYQESDGKITLFKKEDALKATTPSLAKQLCVPFNAEDIYDSEKTLSKEETNTIGHILQKELNAVLRPYQKDGVLWLQQKRKNKHGCLLADEMGLGKTIQILAHLCCINTGSSHLVIAPTSLIYNWQAEINKFAPHLQGKIVLVSYDMLRLHLEDYRQIMYDTIIIDEAQVIKNRRTKKYQAIKELSSYHRIILTGTPIENSIDEIWSHFIILMPQMQSLYDRLQEIAAGSSREAYIALTAKFLKPFILRREKQSVLSDLPDLTEKIVYVEMSPEERAVYNQLHAAILHALSTGLSSRVTSIALEGLLRLRQCCVSVNLLPKSLSGSAVEISSKLQYCLDYIELFKSEHRQVLVFSQFVSALQEMEGILSRNEIQYVSLYGNTRDRKSVVNRFQKDSSITVFLISLKAGGVGLNLTAADRVILLDDWWNPSVEDQATGRAHRIGQKNNVLVLRLVCKDTVEEKILQLQERKRQTVDLFNSADERITMEELRNLLS